MTEDERRFKMSAKMMIMKTALMKMRMKMALVVMNIQRKVKMNSQIEIGDESDDGVGV
jgi:hypothetical protein